MTIGLVPKRSPLGGLIAGSLLILCAGYGNATRAAAPEIRPVSELKVAATIPIAKQTDWVKVTATAVWIGSKGPYAVSEIDPQTNKVVKLELPGDPCGGLAADAENLWVPLCGKTPKLARVDLKKRELTGIFNVGPAVGEGGIAVGAGSVWLIVDKKGSMARIDPANGSIVDTVHLPPGSFNPVFSEGRVWVTRAGGAEVTIVDATTAKVFGHVPVGRHPRFLTAGGGGVWTLNQAEGSLSRLDASGQPPAVTVPLHVPGTGGDIAYADGEVWVTMMKTPLSVVDAARTQVLCQWKGAGGDAIGVGHGSVWLTNLRQGTVTRIALTDVPKDCRAAADK